MATQQQADAYGLLAKQQGVSSGGSSQPVSTSTSTSGGQTTNGSQSNNSNTSNNSSTDSSSNTNSNSSTSNKSTTSSQSSTQNMTPEALAALQGLIAQLMGGGTSAMKEDKARRLGEIDLLSQQRAGYSKQAAFSDASGAMNKALRTTLEKLMPTINAASAGAGTSSNSMRALLAQKAALEASENASALGLNAAFNYGNISNGTSQVLSNLINTPDPQLNALMNALNISKGAITNTKGTQTTTGTQNTVGNQSTTGSQTTVGNQNSSSNTNTSNNVNTVGNEYKGINYSTPPLFIPNTPGSSALSSLPQGIVQQGNTIYDNGNVAYNYGNSQNSILQDMVNSVNGRTPYVF